MASGRMDIRPSAVLLLMATTAPSRSWFVELLLGKLGLS